jgi:hypothetical protein
LGRFLLPAALLLGVAQAHAGLVLHYNLDETSPSNFATDNSVPSYTGILTGMAWTQWTTGKIGGGLMFDGIEDYLNVGGGATMPGGSSARTVSAWFNSFNLSGASTVRTIFGWGNDSWLQLFDISTKSNKLHWHDYGGDFDGGTALSTNTWYHVAATYDGSAKKLYLDGNLDGSSSGVLSTGTANAKAGRQPAISGQYFSGILDDIRVYDSALSASEVAALANPGSAPEPAETFAFLGLLTAAGLGFREWRASRKATA